jgi:acyl carrier protein
MSVQLAELRDQLQQVFHNVFGDESLVLTDAMTAADVDGWDSLANVNLVIAIERHFKVRFATAEISGLKRDGQNVGSLLNLIQTKLTARK